MSLLLTTLVRAGVPESVANAIERGYDPRKGTPASYIAGLGIVALNCAEDLGGRRTLDVLAERAEARA